MHQVTVDILRAGKNHLIKSLLLCLYIYMYVGSVYKKHNVLLIHNINAFIYTSNQQPF